MAREATPGVSRVPEVSIPVGGRCYNAGVSTHQTTPDAQPERRTFPTVSTYSQTPAVLKYHPESDPDGSAWDEIVTDLQEAHGVTPADDDPDFVDPDGYHHYALVPLEVYLAGEESA